jgi:hypothetical protein
MDAIVASTCKRRSVRGKGGSSSFERERENMSEEKEKEIERAGSAQQGVGARFKT